ncbi:hypothetical protein E2562_018961 [Oryza meyeriana var. granulata]|uniref:Uncharacterized protein n=1 Tax=Oryza meyeriana var. granulata TaxID=110450 RepID=A0A6G1DLX0_9ORYZ|nr:hypothetical protein E2562_018961 [Oryza meyeriana var. granulata]
MAYASSVDTHVCRRRRRKRRLSQRIADECHRAAPSASPPRRTPGGCSAVVQLPPPPLVRRLRLFQVQPALVGSSSASTAPAHRPTPLPPIHGFLSPQLQI